MFHPTKSYPPGYQHIPSQGPCDHDCPFSKVRCEMSCQSSLDCTRPELKTNITQWFTRKWWFPSSVLTVIHVQLPYMPMQPTMCVSHPTTNVGDFESQVMENTPPEKTNVEPENHPLWKEFHLPNLYTFWSSMLVFGGCICFVIRFLLYSWNRFGPGLCSHADGIDEGAGKVFTRERPEVFVV